MTPADPRLDQLGPTLRAIVYHLVTEGLCEGIASARRDVDAQAHAMAVNESARPGWVSGTYRDSPAKAAILAALAAMPPGQCDVAGLATAILGALAAPGLDLRALSWHLPDADGLSDAVDLLPAGDGPLAVRARELVAQAVARGADARSCVLTDEAGHACCHVQVV